MDTATVYTDVPTLKDRLDLDGAADDDVLELVIEAASRRIDHYCDRRFYAVTENRYYTAEFADLLFIDDVLSVTTLATDLIADRSYSETWAATDYDLDPPNAAADGLPFTVIRTAPLSNRRFPVGMRRGIKLTGSFGFAVQPPAAVAQACLLQAARWFKRKDAIFGAAGPKALGQVTINVGGGQTAATLDPDVKLMLDPYRKRFGILGV